MRNRLMITKFPLMLVLIVAITGGLFYPTPAAAINIKTNSVITGDTIKLSDIFIGLSETREDKILGPAPRPGNDMVLNARTLMRIAVALDLPWRPQHSGEHVVLSRSASVVEYDMIKDVLETEIASKTNASNTYQIAFSGALSEIILPPEHAPTVDVQSISLRNGDTHFDAVLVAPSKEMPLQTLHVSGAVHRVIEIPVLSESMRGGRVIRERDIDYISLRENEIKSDMVINASELIGMTPRRMVLEGKPVKINDLQAPQIVGRGDLVTITYNNFGMKLSAQGKALESGAKGDLVRVSNAGSNRTVEAIVTGDRQLEVRDF